MYLFVTRGLEYLILSIFILVFGIMIGGTDELLEPYDAIISFNIPEEAVYATGYLLYLALWFFGTETFLQDTIRLDESRMESIKGITQRSKVIIVTLLVLSIVTSLRLFFPNIQDDNPLYYTVIELLFGVASQLAIFLFRV